MFSEVDIGMTTDLDMTSTGAFVAVKSFTSSSSRKGRAYDRWNIAATNIPLFYYYAPHFQFYLAGFPGQHVSFFKSNRRPGLPPHPWLMQWHTYNGEAHSAWCDIIPSEQRSVHAVHEQRSDEINDADDIFSTTPNVLTKLIDNI